MDICIDFDGTCVTHTYPFIGKDIGSVRILKDLVNNGHNLILFTMRSNQHLTEAVDWFVNNGIPLYGIQRNPGQHKWTSSPKAYGQLYIDDAALGAPLITNLEISDRPYIDWIAVEGYLQEKGII